MDAQVVSVETRHCDAGWRNYHFCKVTTADGVVGWSEYDEGFGSPGVTTVIETLAPRVVGHSVHHHERVHAELFAATRPAAGSVVGQGIGAIENALLDARARTLDLPVHDLIGGAQRNRIRVYWSHCGTWRIARHQFYPGDRITDLAGIRAMGEEVRDAGFTALKTNIFTDWDGALRSWAPGFGRPWSPGLNAEPSVIRGIVDVLGAFREGAGPDVDLLLDLNFNLRTAGVVEVLRALDDLDLFWLEYDNDSPDALRVIRDRARTQIASLETKIGLPAFLPFLAAQAVDVAIVDTVWNGTWQSMKIAAAVQAHEVQVAPHNFYGHLSTMMSAHFAAAVPNLRIMEVDIDRLPWDDELFTVTPTFVDGHLVLPEGPGWGTEPIEEALAAHPPTEGPGFLVAGRGS